VIVSTSEVREHVERGDVAKAARLLERPYGVSGQVVTGQGIGAKQTVPTLNLDTAAEVLPADGVYITRTYDLDSPRRWNSITNIGMRPTFGGAERTIETFLLQSLDHPPVRIRVDFLRRVREERKFDDAAALKQQILRDVARAQAYFRRLARWVARELT
jgi:riboflavin kinase / FMN adenylyltransferase